MNLSIESQTLTNTSEFKESLEVRNDTKSESLSKVQGQESLIYEIYITILHWFSKYRGGWIGPQIRGFGLKKLTDCGFRR